MKNKEVRDEVNTRWDEEERSEGWSKHKMGCSIKKWAIK